MKIAKILLSLSMFVMSSCSEKQVWQEVETGKTIKVFSDGFRLNSTNYIYKWSKPAGPEGSKSKYSIEHDKLLFTPLTVGQYQISLEVENMMQTKVHEEIFYFNVIKGNFENTVQASTQDIYKEEVQSSDKTQKQNKSQKTVLNNRYTIQVASWTSLEKAKNDMNELISLEFDTYIEEYYDKKNNVIRWRVRIGSFKSKDLAKEVKEDLSKFRGEDPWITYIK